MESTQLKEKFENFSPKYVEYFTYEELISNMESKSQMKFIEIGKSKKGKNINAYSLGEGKTRVMAYGLPHSDEVVGSLTIDYLTDFILENKEWLRDFTFLLIPCIDPDGLEMNEGWLKGKFTPSKFFLNRYHRPDIEDIDWGFPIDTEQYTFKTEIPETKILTRLIHEFKPHFFTSLHSIQFSGVHFYFDNYYPKLFDRIEKFIDTTNIPLQKGTPFFIEAEQAFRLGFYRVYSTKEMINDYLLNETDISTLRRGEFSTSYYLNSFPKGMVIVPEVPLYFDAEIYNLDTSNRTIRETSIFASQTMLDILGFIEPIWKNNKKSLNSSHHQFARIEDITSTWRKELKEEIKLIKKSYSKELATKSEVFSNEVIVFYNGCNTLGSFYQLIKNSQELKEPKREEILQIIADEMRRIETEVRKRSKIQISDLNEMVQIQAFSILSSLEHLKEKKKRKD